MEFWSTREVARLLGVSVALLTKAVWSNRVDPPQKSPSGNYLWTLADINRASWVIHHRPFERTAQGTASPTPEATP
jgi:hypothetical protein